MCKSYHGVWESIPAGSHGLRWIPMTAVMGILVNLHIPAWKIMIGDTPNFATADVDWRHEIQEET
jgi:hypothetical protein